MYVCMHVKGGGGGWARAWAWGLWGLGLGYSTLYVRCFVKSSNRVSVTDASRSKFVFFFSFSLLGYDTCRYCIYLHMHSKSTYILAIYLRGEGGEEWVNELNWNIDYPAWLSTYTYIHKLSQLSV